MKSRLGRPLALALIVFLNTPVIRAQGILDRLVVGGPSGFPLVITAVNSGAIGQLSATTGVPIGLEEVPAPAQPGRQPRWSIAATGKTLGEVLGAIVAADARYEWREDNGIVVVRPVSAWSDSASVLHIRLSAVALTDVTATEAMKFIARMFGVKGEAHGPGDTKRFSVELPDGSTVLDVLNATVRAHGTLSWTFEPLRNNDEFPMSVTLFIRGSGAGVGIPAGARVSTPAAVLGTSPPGSERLPALERTVGAGQNGEPLVVHGVYAGLIPRLALAAQVPMGLETFSPERFSPSVRKGAQKSITVSGLKLRDALDALVSLDPRFEWREFDGVVVLRPAIAWQDPSDPLFRLVTNFRVNDAPLGTAMSAFARLFGAPENGDFPDSRRFSVEVAQGSALDVLNAIVRSHGETSWHWEELSEHERKVQPFFPKRRYSLVFRGFAGAGRGVTLP